MDYCMSNLHIFSKRGPRLINNSKWCLFLSDLHRDDVVSGGTC